MTPTRVVVIGGGFLGQLVQFAVPYARVLDWRKAPVGRDTYQTRYFGAHYLWQPLPGLPCTPVDVHTTVDNQAPEEDAIRRYKEKVGKMSDIIDWNGQFKEHQTGWEIADVPGSVVDYSQFVQSVNWKTRTLTLRDVGAVAYDMLVSTIPLPALLRLLGGPALDPVNRPIYVSVTPAPARPRVRGLHVDYCSTIGDPVYRKTNRHGLELHRESLEVVSDGPCTPLYPGKIYVHPRVPALQHALIARHIFCFGRNATWSPDELAHETYANILEWKQRWAL
jgi:hypothetical protein